MDDSVITAKVEAATFSDSDLKVNAINGETFKGVAQQGGPGCTRGRGRDIRQE